MAAAYAATRTHTYVHTHTHTYTAESNVHKLSYAGAAAVCVDWADIHTRRRRRRQMSEDDAEHVIGFNAANFRLPFSPISRVL